MISWKQLAIRYKEVIEKGFKPTEFRVRETELRQTVENTISDAGALNYYVYKDLPKIIGGAKVVYIDDPGHWYLIGSKGSKADSDTPYEEYMATGEYA